MFSIKSPIFVGKFGNMRILWLDINSSYAHSSLALPALHAQMGDNSGVEWTIVKGSLNESVGTMVEQSLDAAPDILCATAWLFTHEMLLHVVSRIKAVMPRLCVIFGGPEFLGGNEHYLRHNTFVDCVFRGEAEEIFPQWVACYDDKTKWKAIKGLCYIGADGTYYDNGMARVADVNALVPPEQSSMFSWDKPFVQLETTRGCFNTCSFCVSGGDKPVRTLDVETVRCRLEDIKKHGIRDVRVLDRTFNYNNKRAIQMLEMFKTYTGVMRFHLEIHPALLTDTMREAIADMPSGLLHLEAGIQSLHSDVLTASRRVGDLEASLSGLRFLCSLPNVVTHADLIAGLPHYTLDSLVEDVRTLVGYGAQEIQLESLKVLPGTEMRRRAEEWGIRYSPFPPYEVLCTDSITAGELQAARRLSRMIDAYYNTEAWQAVTAKLILCDEHFLRCFLQHLVEINIIDQPTSLEKRGLVLYNYCKTHHPDMLRDVTKAWIEAGLSLRKEPASAVLTKHITPCDDWMILRGEYKPSLRLCFLPAEKSEDRGIWYGYETERLEHRPVFVAEKK